VKVESPHRVRDGILRDDRSDGRPALRIIHGRHDPDRFVHQPGDEGRVERNHNTIDRYDARLRIDAIADASGCSVNGDASLLNENIRLAT
jgi:hypothetical protein